MVAYFIFPTGGWFIGKIYRSYGQI